MSLSVKSIHLRETNMSVANSDFLQMEVWGYHPITWPDSPQKLHKMKEIGPRAGSGTHVKNC